MILRKTQGPAEPAHFLAGMIADNLNKNKSVLWLVPGGSAIEAALKTAALLEGQDLNLLSVSLTDERFGPPGHSDSNWQQLTDRGFKLSGASLHPVLEGQDMSLTTANYDDYLRTRLGQADYSVGLFGMGADGHGAGILPGSPAVTSKDFVSSYLGPDFKRITMTPKAIAKLDTALIYALGDAKRPALNQLEQNVPLAVMPAQAFKLAGQFIVYNDYKGE